MRRWLTLCALLGSISLSAQPSTNVVAEWDLHPSHDGASFELEVDGTPRPCAPVVVLPTARRCGPVAVASGVPHTFRLRGVITEGAGEWSPPVSTGGLPPGLFTVTLVQAPDPEPEPAPEPEPTDVPTILGIAAFSATGQTNPSAEAITIPDGATYALVTLTGYAPGGYQFTSVALGASSGSRVAFAGGGDSENVDVWEITSVPAPGASTIDVALNASTGEGGGYLVIFFSGVDLVSPVRDTDTDTLATGGASGVSGTVDSAVTDLVIGVLASYTQEHAGSAAPGGSGQTQVDAHTEGQVATVMGVEDAAGASTTTFTATGAYPGLVVISLRAEDGGGGGGGSILLQMLQQH